MPWNPTNIDVQLQRRVENVLRDATYGWIKGFAGSGKTWILKEILKKYKATHPYDSVCYVTFTNALTNMVQEGDDLNDCDVMTHTQFLKRQIKYDFVGVDEVQDISERDLYKIKALSGKVIICGDSAQKIYENGVEDVSIPKILPNLRTEILSTVYRTTRKVLEAAEEIYPNSHILEARCGDSEFKKGVDVRYKNFDSKKKEVEFVWKDALDNAIPLEPAAILLPRHYDIGQFSKILAEVLGLPTPPKKHGKDYTEFNEFWEDHNIPFEYLGGGSGSYGDSKYSPTVYILTYHSSKGLDFANVHLPFFNHRLSIGTTSGEMDELARKRLLFVAATRSRGDLTFTYSEGDPHPYLEDLIDKALVTRIVDHEDESNQTEEDDDDEFF